MDREKLIKYVLEATRILRMPRQNIATFGASDINYYFLSNIDGSTKVREGKVLSRRPEIIPAAGIKEIFDGFGDYPEKYTDEISRQLGKDIRVINYRFKNSLKNISRVNEPLRTVYERVLKEIKEKDSQRSAVIKGSETAWQISVMKFIIDYTMRSAPHNIRELQQKGMFPDEQGIPEYVRNRIKFLFREAEKKPEAIDELGRYLHEKGLFEQYEDLFFKLFSL